MKVDMIDLKASSRLILAKKLAYGSAAITMLWAFLGPVMLERLFGTTWREVYSYPIIPMFVVTIGAIFYAVHVSVLRDEEFKTAVPNLFDERMQASEWQNASLLLFEDSGEGMMVASDGSKIAVCLNTAYALGLYALDRDEITTIQVKCRPSNLLKVKGTGGSGDSFLLGGAMVGGITGAVITSTIASISDQLKKSGTVAYNLDFVFKSADDRPLILRAVRRACEHPSTQQGRSDLQKTTNDMSKMILFLEKHLSEKIAR